MSLIIKDKIPMFLKGYPTISDKYNIGGGILQGDTAVQFGELVKYSATTGYYEAIKATVTLADIAGFAVATNVKLAEGFADNEVQINPTEPFNVLINGYIAIELTDAVVANIEPNKAVAVFLNTAAKYGKLTTSGVSGATDLPGVVFTGLYENIGTTDAPVYLAEICVK